MADSNLEPTLSDGAMEGPNITKQDELDLALRQLRDILTQNQEKIRLELEKDCERLQEGQKE